MDVTLLGVLAVSWVLGWLGARPPEVNRAVRAFRALMAHRRLTGLVVGPGFLALYFWTQRVRVRSEASPLPGVPLATGCFPGPAETVGQAV